MSQDVLALLKEDHQAAETLLGQFDTTISAQRDEYFCEVVQTLVGHEVAEELVVYPAIRTAPDGDAVADARLSEQSEAERLLADMEHLDSDTGEFEASFYRLRDAVLAHASAEEATAFRILEALTTEAERLDLGGRYQKAKDTAPTHPHPHAPDTPPGNKLVGPIAAIFDRARDAVHHR